MYVRSLVFLLVTLTVSASFGYIKDESPTPISLTRELRSAGKLRLHLTQNELRIKKELLHLKKTDKKKFDALTEGSLENPVDYQSYVYEVRDGVAAIETAKLVAQKQMYQAVKDNWGEVRRTVLNDVGAPNWRKFEPRLKEKLREDLTYVPSKKLGIKEMTFVAGDWGTITISKDKKGYTSSWGLDIASQRDSNKLQPGAENIKTEEQPAASSVTKH